MTNNKENGSSQTFNLQEEILSITNLRTEIRIQESRINKEKGYLKNPRKEMQEKLEIVQDKIKSGKASTGDKIKDFALVCLNGSEKYEQLYNLEKQLKKHPRELVLKTRETIEFKQGKKIPDKEFTLGIIKNTEPLEMNIESTQISLSAKKTINFNKSCNFKKHVPWESTNPVSIFNWELGQAVGKNEELFIGNEQVFEAFKNESLLERVSPFCEKLLGKKLSFEKTITYKFKSS